SVFFFSSRRRHTRFSRDWSSDVCSSDLEALRRAVAGLAAVKSRSPSGQVEPEEEEGLAAYRALLPPMALATFAAEPDEGAWMPPSGLIEPGWDELSMLAAILSGETRLDGVHVDGEGTAELQFTALAW